MTAQDARAGWQLDGDGSLWEDIEEGVVGGGYRYRLRRRRPVDRATYQQRIREQVDDATRRASGGRVPAPEPLPEVLVWAATRLDQQPEVG
jgi:hypothetical protein